MFSFKIGSITLAPELDQDPNWAKIPDPVPDPNLYIWIHNSGPFHYFP